MRNDRLELIIIHIFCFCNATVVYVQYHVFFPAQVSRERGEQLAIEYGIKFMETSAKASINVEEAFYTLARDIKAKTEKKLVSVCLGFCCLLVVTPAPHTSVSFLKRKKNGGFVKCAHIYLYFSLVFLEVLVLFNIFCSLCPCFSMI